MCPSLAFCYPPGPELDPPEMPDAVLPPEIYGGIPEITCPSLPNIDGTCETQRMACELVQLLWAWESGNVNISQVKNSLSRQCFLKEATVDTRFTSCPVCPGKTYWSIDAMTQLEEKKHSTASECRSLCARSDSCGVSLIEPDPEDATPGTGTCITYKVAPDAFFVAGCSPDMAKNARHYGFVKKQSVSNSIDQGRGRLMWNCNGSTYCETNNCRTLRTWETGDFNHRTSHIEFDWIDTATYESCAPNTVEYMDSNPGGRFSFVSGSGSRQR